MKAKRGLIISVLSFPVACQVMGVALSACVTFSELDDLTGGDASTVAADSGLSRDASPDALSGDASDASADALAADASGCGFSGPTDGLLAYYPFEEGDGGIIHDCSPNHFDGAFVQQASGGNWAAGKLGGGIRVNATNGCVDVGAPAAFHSSTLSISAWANVVTFPNPGASGYIVGQSNNANVDGWRFGSEISDAGTLFGWQSVVSSTPYLLDVSAPPAASWHQLVVTLVPSSALQIFVDGVLAKTLSGVPAVAYDAAHLRIGCRADGANSFDGYIDEVRIYNRALTGAEIMALAQ